MCGFFVKEIGRATKATKKPLEFLLMELFKQFGKCPLGS